MKPCSVCVHVCGTKRVYWTHRPHCIDLNYTLLIVCVHRLELYRPHCMCTQTCYTLLIVCVHRLELLGGNIWWTRSDCSHTTQVWEDCAVTGMVKVACEWASFCYVAVQECCSDTHCLGHLCSIFPIGCTPLKHIIIQSLISRPFLGMRLQPYIAATHLPTIHGFLGCGEDKFNMIRHNSAFRPRQCCNVSTLQFS